MMQATRVNASIGLAKDMKDTAIDDVIKFRGVPLAKFQRIADEEVNSKCALFCFCLRPLDRQRDGIVTRHIASALGKEHCVLAGAAATVQQLTGNTVRHSNQIWLRAG